MFPFLSQQEPEKFSQLLTYQGFVNLSILDSRLFEGRETKMVLKETIQLTVYMSIFMYYIYMLINNNNNNYGYGYNRNNNILYAYIIYVS